MRDEDMQTRHSLIDWLTFFASTGFIIGTGMLFVVNESRLALFCYVPALIALIVALNIHIRRRLSRR